MGKKLKGMKKAKVILGWVFVLALLVSSLSFVQKRNNELPCRYVKVQILDSLQNGFITKSDVMALVHKHYEQLLGLPIHTINTEKLENILLNNRAISTCDIYITQDGTLHIEIMQRQPVLRIINQRGQSYYISHDGYLIPFSRVHSPNVLVANGHIRENYEPDLQKYGHVDQFENMEKENILADLHDFAAYIYEDEFWKSQIVQIYVDKKGEIELIPRVGAHIIMLGKTTGYETKLLKLKALYLKGLNNIGWNQYETINLKYKNQVICSKR
jgi:cell division protein FtsQ